MFAKRPLCELTKRPTSGIKAIQTFRFYTRQVFLNQVQGGSLPEESGLVDLLDLFLLVMFYGFYHGIHHH